MVSSIYPISIGISIVILSLAVAIVAIIKAKYKFNVNVENERKEIQNEGLTGRSIPITKEEFSKCRGEEKISYQEALLVEQLGYRIEVSGINLNNVSAQIAEFQTIKSKAKKDSLIDNFNAAKEHYCNAFDAAAYWHLEGLISFSVYKEHFLRPTIGIYNNIDIGKKWSNIRIIKEKYGHLIEDNETSDTEEE